MARIVKCDKCGKEIKREDESYDIRIGRECQLMNRFDICIDCYRELLSMLSVNGEDSNDASKTV